MRIYFAGQRFVVFHGGDYEEWRLLECYAVWPTDVSEELIASFIRVTRIGELGTTLAATSNRRTHRRNTKSHSHRRENLKPYMLHPVYPVPSITRYFLAACVGC
jgi:hypothetical protein